MLHLRKHTLAWVMLLTAALACSAPASTPSPTAPSASATSPSPAPPIPTSTLLPMPPTITPSSTPVPPTATLAPTRVPPTRTSVPRPSSTPLRPAATSAPAPTRPPAAQGETLLTVSNTFADGCRLVLWGPADVTIDVVNGATETRSIKPGSYGWRVFIGGRSTEQADNLVAPAGGRCQFVCDGAAKAIRWGCR